MITNYLETKPVGQNKSGHKQGIFQYTITQNTIKYLIHSHNHNNKIYMKHIHNSHISTSLIVWRIANLYHCFCVLMRLVDTDCDVCCGLNNIYWKKFTHCIIISLLFFILIISVLQQWIKLLIIYKSNLAYMFRLWLLN